MKRESGGRDRPLIVGMCMYDNNSRVEMTGLGLCWRQAEMLIPGGALDRCICPLLLLLLLLQGRRRRGDHSAV